MREKSGKLLDIFIRYFILIIVSVPNLWIFYLIFTPLTVYFVYFLLSLFFQVSLSGNTILISKIFSVELIEACIAGSAYYLLLILNLSVPKIKISKRIKLILFSFLSFFAVNIIRIIVMSIILVNGSSLFDTLHILFWYAGSIIFVVGIWFIGIKIFHVKEMPFYSDIKTLIKLRKK
jgi:exosortase/archaeosortase family protein